MIGWWRARLTWVTLSVTVLSAAAAWLLWPLGLVLPNLPQGRLNSFSLAYAVAFLPAHTWLAVRDLRPVPLEVVSTRRMQLGLLDAAEALGPTAAVMLTLVAFGSPTVQGAGRTMLVASATALIAASVLPRRIAFLLPGGYLIAAGTLGFGASHSVPHGWAFILGRWLPDRDIPLTLAITALAIVVHIARSGKT